MTGPISNRRVLVASERDGGGYAPPGPHLVALLRFALPRPVIGAIEVFDVGGRRVRTILAGEIPGGEQACSWDGLDDENRPVPPGDYCLRLVVDDRTLTGRRVSITG